MTVGDVYYVLFRHKWKILLLSLAGILAAAAFYHFHPPLYQSQAELLIKYVPEAKAMVLGGETIMPGSGVEDVINSEIQILTSLDLAEEAVTNLTATTIMAQAGGGNNSLAAAAFIRSHLHAEPTSRGGSVILVTFRHPDPQIVQPVLQEIIDDYFHRHYEIHQAVGQFDENLSRERADLQLQLDDTERRLAEVKNKANILSLEDTKSSLSGQITRIQASILDAEAELNQYGVTTAEAEKLPAVKPSANTNPPPAVTPEQIQAYEDLNARLIYLRKQQQSYINQGFTAENVLVKEVAKQIADTAKAASSLETTYPQLAKLSTALAASDNKTDASDNTILAKSEKIEALKAKIGALKWQLNQLWEQSSNLNNLTPVVAQLERTKQIQETNYENLAVSLEQAHINEALATGKAPNIRWVQAPSPPFQDWNKTYQRMAVLALGGILLGLAWAFLIELYLDRSVKRPIEVETKLKMPFFLSIPDVSRNGKAHVAPPAQRKQLPMPGPAEEPAPDANLGVPARRPTGVEVVSLEKNRPLQNFFDALRDRLIVHFEVKNLTHNPKLVAVTGAHHGSGVSTIAAGLAASLSETGDGNVLLVDMNLENGAAQQFHKGKSVCSLDAALNRETMENAQVQENLYVVSDEANGSDLPKVLPKRFSNLVPKLRASDYDYIIFDLPPVSQTSVTPRISRYMDMVLMVIESEKTDRDAVQRANKLLLETGASVSAVLNKTKNYVPKKLDQGYLGDA